MTDVILDLDGVVYRGGRAIDGAPAALARLREAGIQPLFVTNNSTRTPKATAAKLLDLTGVAVDPDQVLTSAMAAASMLRAGDAPVLPVGDEGVRAAIDSVGLPMTDDPHAARGVVVGLTRSIDYDTIARAMSAVRTGARFIATNADPTFPTEDGFQPGCGAIVAAIATASGGTPEVAGKPHAPMRSLIRARGVASAWVVGDRVDTDVALGNAEDDWTSVLVLSGVTGADEARESGADHVSADLSGAVDLVLTGHQRS